MTKTTTARWKAALLSVLLCLFALSASALDKKVSVSEVVFDSPVEDVQWLETSYKTVLVRTMNGRLYRSGNSGRSWTEITHLIKPAATASSSRRGSSWHDAVDDEDHLAADVDEENSRKEHRSPSAESIVLSPSDKSTVLIVGRHNAHFISTDAARSFRQIRHQGSVHHFLFHPTRRSWALMSSWTAGCSSSAAREGNNAAAAAATPCRHDLYFTDDLGHSWSLVASYVVQFSWGDPKLNQQDAVLLSHFDRAPRGHQPRGAGWSDDISFAIASSPKSRPMRLVRGGNKFLASGGFLFVAKVKDKARQTVELLVSTDGGETFKAAKLPVPLEEKSYTLLDVSEGAVMLHVNHGHDADSGIAVGNVYVSDASGTRFSLSLPKNVRTPTGECEFDKVQSLEGIYIANFRDTGPRKSVEEADDGDQGDPDDEEDEDWLDSEEEERFFGSGRIGGGSGARSGHSETIVRTVISFDKGGVWSYLTPPRVDSRGHVINCDELYNRGSAPLPNLNVAHLEGQQSRETQGCYLHLHGVSNFHRFAPFYSVNNAVGLVMGTGNVGPSLRYDSDEVNTYLSRDGGLTWVEAHKGAYIYEFGDHGGLVVMANDLKKTNQVVFSWNEGQSWYDFDLGDDLISVDNIVIEPNTSSVEFLLYGTRGTAGVLYHLDFATLGQPACKGAWAADSVSSDYETWTPTDGRTGDSCILGKSTVFTRRKQTSECFNGQEFERPKTTKTCSCTERDFQCEFGFTREIDSFQCRPEDPNLDFEGCSSGGLFYANAYRKVPGDVCEGGWIPEKVPVICPAHSPFSSRAKVTLISVMGIVAAMALLTWMSSDPRYQRFVSPALDGMATAKYAVLGGAARFLDAFDYNAKEKDATPTPSSDAAAFFGKDENGDAPALLDFTIPGSNTTVLRGVDTARDPVPRLQPPSSSSPPREFEML